MKSNRFQSLVEVWSWVLLAGLKLIYQKNGRETDRQMLKLSGKNLTKNTHKTKLASKHKQNMINHLWSAWLLANLEGPMK